MTTSTTHTQARPSITYGECSVRDLVCHAEKTQTGKLVVKQIDLNGRPLAPSQRFWTGLQVRFGFSKNIFHYFNHAEVFQRISEVAPSDKFRFCVEEGPPVHLGGAGDGKQIEGRLLSVSPLTKPVVTYDDLHNLLERYEAHNISYHDGVVRSEHTPRGGGGARLAGDDFVDRFYIDTPIDGYGLPATYLGLLRMICTNGAIAYTKAFKSEVSVGKKDDNVVYALTRVLDGFTNEEGFQALHQRFESAAGSWASVNEVNKLYKALVRQIYNGHVHDERVAIGADGVAVNHLNLGGAVNQALAETTDTDDAKDATGQSKILRAFYDLTGDLSKQYGLANLDALSVKRQRVLPTKAKVYDLLNFASEIATHRADHIGSRALHAILGDWVGAEYDLEGTCQKFGDWNDFFIQDGATADAMAHVKALNA